MNFDLSEEQQMFVTSVERFAAPIDVEARRRLRLSPTGYDRARWQSLAEMGLIALAASEDAGGMGGSPLDLALVAEAIGKANAPDPLIEHGVLPTLLLERGQAHEALEGVLAGTTIATFAWTERGQRYSLRAKGMKAESTGDGFVLSGEKTMVMGALIGDLFIVTADIGGEIACFLVPKDAPGLEVRAYRLADGSIAGELKLTRTPAAARLTLNAAALDGIVAEVRLLAAAEMVGLGQRLLDDTLAYVKERQQFGVAIGSFQALQHRLVDCYAREEQARSMLYRAALSDRGDTAAWQRAAAGAKAFIGENVDAIAREAVQMHGGMGITDELAIGHALKRVLLLARLFGDVDTVLAEYALAA
ncbi:MAG: acyl-CoA dehydrogenase [Erythrobacter sp.]|jgi:alkylation response protein AidB-like acyl-CoA dehydrogenase|uniref:acyl-CoA dehydrogenase family protein n=1 Tax=Erythrobacter sp. TaxID=1042 RepID=UPI002B48AE85|nr:acyl-CoA dehydrogenase [Erythrobacter sp.]WRH69488.1 MAG: acyl-CoA dehydrogenase [Erythrobacter sp.]